MGEECYGVGCGEIVCVVVVGFFGGIDVGCGICVKEEMFVI